MQIFTDAVLIDNGESDFHGYRTYLILILALFGFLLVDFVRFDPSNDDDMAGFFASYYNFVLWFIPILVLSLHNAKSDGYFQTVVLIEQLWMYELQYQINNIRDQIGS